MGFHLTKRIIKLLCGPEQTERGESYVRNGKVSWSHTDEDSDRYKGIVSGNRMYNVDILITPNGDVDAECDCLASVTDEKYCKHVAAVLLGIHQSVFGDEDGPVRSYDNESGGAAGEGILTPRKKVGIRERWKLPYQQEPDYALADRVLNALSASGDSRARGRLSSAILHDAREPLQLEITCRLVPHGYAHQIAVELKVGASRLYQVQRIKDFLNHMDARQPFMFTKNFTLLHELHRLLPEDEAVIAKLIEIIRQEKQYIETMFRSTFMPSRSTQSDRLLVVPPFAWENLLSVLMEASRVKVVFQPDHSRYAREFSYEGLLLAENKPPLRFKFDQSPSDSDDYELEFEGVAALAVLDGYGMAFRDGGLYRIAEDAAKQLLDLKQMLTLGDRETIHISAAQMEKFVDRAMPALLKLGEVHLSETVKQRMVYKPLQARLYLDRIRDRLLAGIEFQYGDIVINPLDDSGKQRGEARILMRDGDKERQIMELLNDERFGRTEGGFIIEGDDAEYEFLYHRVPRLEALMGIYATSAVKLRLADELALPKVHISWEERTNWLEFKFQLDGVTEKEIKELIIAMEHKRRYYKLASGALLPLESKSFEALLRVMNGVGLHHMALHGDTVRLPAVRALGLLDLPERLPELKLGASVRTLLDNLRNPDQLDFPLPDQLQADLRDYQQYGYQWMRTLAHYRFGGILADEMGLGKTVQSIAFLASQLPEIRELGLPALIVAPASLMYNWLNELGRFAPSMRAVIADGTKEERTRIAALSGSGVPTIDMTLNGEGLVGDDVGAIADSDTVDSGDGARADIIITSYPLLRRDAESYASRQFHTIILDEAQAFKNSHTQTYTAVRSLKSQYCFALTGTPIENRTEELRAIFEIVFPGLFPGRQEFSELARESIARRSRPFLLRRLKSDVLRELPDKIESVQSSALLPEQKKLYAAYLAKLREETLKHLDKSKDFGRAKIRILAGITRLRQICCHPALFVEGYTGSSAKFEQLLELIEECIDSGKRMLIFSQFTEMLGLIRRELGYRGISHFYLDGQTPAAERVELCSRFNEGERELFLLSLKAGGTGLNLTGADTVILYDLWWNPAVEQQAADRAHRIGQRNTVQIIRLVSHGTIEDKMYELQERKRSLIDEVIGQGQNAEGGLSEQELRELLNL